MVLPIYQKNQWEAIRDTDTGIDKTWDEWNAEGKEIIADFEARGIPYVQVPMDVDEQDQKQELTREQKKAIQTKWEDEYPLLAENEIFMIPLTVYQLNGLAGILDSAIIMFEGHLAHGQDPDDLHDVKGMLEGFQDLSRMLWAKIQDVDQILQAESQSEKK